MVLDPSKYKTGNPLESNNAKDLDDNARVIDVIANDLSGENVLDRFGNERRTLKGLENEYLTAIQGIEGNPLGAWTAGVTTFNALNDYAIYNGVPYRARTTTTLPYVAQGADPTASPDNAFIQPYQQNDYGTIAAGVEVKHRRGTSAEIAAYTLADGEIIKNDDDGSLHVGDGATLGGVKHTTVNMVSLMFKSVADAKSSYNSLNVKLGDIIGSTIAVEDYYGGSSPNNSGVLFFKVVASGTGTDDGGKYIDADDGTFQLEQNLPTNYPITCWGAISDWDGLVGTDNRDYVNNAMLYADIVTAPNGAFYFDSTITIRTDDGIIGNGRNNTTFVFKQDIDGIYLNSNARRIKLKGMTLTAAATSTGSAITADPVQGSAESTFDDLLISRAFAVGIDVADLWWNNIFKDSRIECATCLSIAGTTGSSIKNHFDNVYFNGVNLGAFSLALNLSATKNTKFTNCNFGMNFDANGGRFLQASSSNNGLTFDTCNFEECFVLDNQGAFNMFDRTQAQFTSCSFVKITGNGASSNSALFRANGNESWAILENCTFGTTAEPTTEFFGRLNGGNLYLFNSPQFDQPAKYNYEAAGSEFVFDAAKVKTTQSGVDHVIGDPSVSRGNRMYGKSRTNKYSITSTANLPMLDFTYSTPSDSASSATTGGEFDVSIAARSTAGVRCSAVAKFNVYFNNDGLFSYNKEWIHSQGSRTIDLDLVQNVNTIELVITPSADSINDGEVTGYFDFRTSENSNGDIDVDFV